MFMFEKAIFNYSAKVHTAMIEKVKQFRVIM